MQDKLIWKPAKTGSETTRRPSPRWGHCSCIVDDQLILFGGYANSVYMNDMWIFNTISMQWSQVRTTGQIPCFRSNSSLNYDHVNNRLVLFGGGSQNKRRYNQIHLLDWQTKHWTIISFSENQTAPWERTYHSAELIYPYLITFGGEGMTDCDDLWVFNFETLKWSEVIFPQNAVRPCGRRFHTSCMVGNEFFVIGGCYSKYRPLSDIFSIDLTRLIQTGSVQGLQWKQRLNHHGFLTRWGQSLAVKGNDIYIFGGRFINDLNDLVVFNAEKNKINVLEVASDSIPKPRRRSSLSFVGNCLLMFGGFNSDYYNDLHYINIGQLKPKIKRSLRSHENLKPGMYESFCDFSISSNSGKMFNCHKGIFMQFFNGQSHLENFLLNINGKLGDSELSEMIEQIYQGYGKGKILNKNLIQIPETIAQKQSQFINSISALKPQKQNQGLACSHTTNILFKLPRAEYYQYMSKQMQNMYKDLTINFYFQETSTFLNAHLNRIVLMKNSRYFSNFLARQSPKQDMCGLIIPLGKAMDLQILLTCLMTGYMVIPEDLTTTDLISLYQLADYFSLNEIKTIIRYQLGTMITEASLNDIFKFAEQYNLEDLAIICAHFSQSKAGNSEINQQNKYYQISYSMNKFEIRQEAMTKNIPFVCKNKNSSTEVAEEDKQNAETCRA